MKTKRRNRALRCESLERREMMAGWVSAWVDQGVLKVTGDNLANCVEVRPGPAAGQVEVIGKVVAGSQTIINRGTHVVLSGVTSGIDVRLNGGDDKLEIHGWTPSIPLSIPAAAGLYVNMGSGNDNVSAYALNCSGPANIVTESGNDFAGVYSSKFHSNLSIFTGSGDDAVQVQNTQIEHTLTVDTGTGGQLFNSGNDRLVLDHAITNWMQISMGSGDDTATILNTRCNLWHPTLNGGPGNDTLYIRSSALVDAVLMNWEHVL